MPSIWPEIIADVPAIERPLADRLLRLPLIVVDEGRGLVDAWSWHAAGTDGLLILRGVVLKQTTLCGRHALELLGPGDRLLSPSTLPHRRDRERGTSYVVPEAATLAVMDDRCRRAAQRWPSVGDFLHRQLGRQMDRASTHAARLHLPRVEDRLTDLFVELAERFGRVDAAGVCIDLRLTHETIGGLVGSRRPTVSLGLGSLARKGLIERMADGHWQLAQQLLGEMGDVLARRNGRSVETDRFTP